MPKDKPRGWYSEEWGVPLHPTVTVHEQERRTLYLPDGTEITAKPALGFRASNKRKETS